MTEPVSHWRIVQSIVRKDLVEYSRDRLWFFLTTLVLVAVVALFWILPDEVEERINVGVAGLPGPEALAGLGEEAAGLRIVSFASSTDLEEVVGGEAGAWAVNGTAVTDSGSQPEGAESVDVDLGLAFPADFLESLASGERPEVTVYVNAAVPQETETAMTSLIRELSVALAGGDLPIETLDPAEVYVVLGEDRIGTQVSAREAFRPLFVFLVLLMEMFVMASLIAREIQERTISAILVTPATVSDVLTAKGVAGALSGLAQGVVVLVAIGALGDHPALILTLLALGSVMISGTAMIAGSSGRDFISTLFYGMAYMIPLLIPAFAALFPGTASAWIRALPSYPFVQGLVEVTTYGAGWADTLPQLGLLGAWCVALFGLGWVVLSRKVRTL